MTDQLPCPRCGCTVSGTANYFFIPAENLRWHQRCWNWKSWRPEPIEPIQDQIEEKAQ